MSDVPDPYDRTLAMRGVGLLRELNVAGILDAADVHVADRLGELGMEPDERVRLAAALAVRALRLGSVCVDLAEAARIDPARAWPEQPAWSDAVRASVLVGAGKPLRLDAGLLYLERYWQQESQVCVDLLDRELHPPPAIDISRVRAGVERLFGVGADADAQRVAAVVAVTRWTTVLGGGPGTGKTTTIARLLALLLDQHDRTLRVALAAPTGKAAARLEEAVHAVAATLGSSDRERLDPLTASTVHRLLGSLPGRGSRFRHDRDNRLPYDVVVVDETSMLSLTLMARLIAAVRPQTRLILVGDPDQLQSVEAGVVLADLVAGLTARPVPTGPARSSLAAVEAILPHDLDSTPGWPHGVVVLNRTWRFGGAIAKLAAAVRDGDADRAAAVLISGAPGIQFGDDGVRSDVVDAATGVEAAARTGDAAAALRLLMSHRLLCAHRAGPYGVDQWSRDIERWLAEERAGHPPGEWHVGRPVLVTANDYPLGLYNGDTGVAIRQPDGALRVAFLRGESIATFAPSRLANVQTVYAMTVHRSQGSQFRRVSLVLPPEDSPLLTRELLYTAITRAEEQVRIVGTEAAFRAAVERPAARASGLRERLARPMT